jgi:hypothetical protein
MRAARVVGVLFFFATPAGCQAVLGDLDGYSLRPNCDLLHPTMGKQICAMDQRCSFQAAAGGPSSACATAGNIDADFPCTSEGDCVSGQGCHKLSTDSRCLPYCVVGGDACAAGRTCQTTAGDPRYLDGTQYGFCYPPPCNPEKPTDTSAPYVACQADETCALLNDDYSLCDPAGTSGQGAACNFTYECSARYLCVGTPSGSFCEAYCKLPSSNCLVGSCTGFSPPLIQGGQEYGSCVPGQ